MGVRDKHLLFGEKKAERYEQVLVKKKSKKKSKKLTSPKHCLEKVKYAFKCDNFVCTNRASTMGYENFTTPTCEEFVRIFHNV